ncbi:MAG: AMP-binding protein [Planctomycetota bacterium]
MAETLSALLREQARLRPDAEALVVPAFAHGGRALRLTWAQLDARVDDLARGLLALGLERGERAAIWAANVPDWVPLEYALARIGAVLVTVNSGLSRDEVAYVLKQSQAVAVLHSARTGSNEASRSLDELLEAGDPALARLRVRLWLPALPDEEPPLGVAPGGGRGALLDPESLVARGRGIEPAALAAREAEVAPGDLVNIQYTSGTTGLPKGVMLSHRNVLGSGRALGALLRTTPADRLAMIVPLFHCFGCVVCVLGAATHGATLVCLPGFEPGAALRLIEEERCTLVHGVPTMFSALLAHEELPRRSLRTLRAGLVAGAPCPEPLMEAIAERLPCPGIAVTYGLTEASPGVAGTPPDGPLDERLRTIGRPLPEVETRIMDPASFRELPDGQAGELWVRGENVMLGYHDEPRATAAAIVDGWLRTGDLCTRTPDGVLRVTGRLKDIIIRGGENIAPAEIENALRGHEAVLDAAVVGIPDERFGEAVAAALVLRPGVSLDAAGFRAFLRGKLASFKIPEAWLAVEKLPLTGSGKVQKFKLRTRFAPIERHSA